MPALRLSMRELVEAFVKVLGPDVRGLVTFAPDARIETQFGAQPPITTQIADRLGMKHDGDAVISSATFSERCRTTFRR